MMKKIISLCAVFLMLLSIILSGVTSYAINPIEPYRACSLTVVYGCGEAVFEGLEVKIYRIAAVSEDGTYELTDAFRDYSVSIYGITSQTEWKAVTSTLAAYIAADGIEATYEKKTDENGSAAFENISTGMYLVTEIKTSSDETVITFESFLVAVPSPKDSGEHLYDVTARPKYSAYTPTKNEVSYKIIKQWKDEGNAANRPESVKIDLIKDGAVHSTVTLSSKNNWSYNWTSEDDGSNWQAVERNIPDDYYVTVECDGTTMIVTNTCFKSPENPPQTNDMNTTQPYVILMSFSGVLLMIVSLFLKRSER